MTQVSSPPAPADDDQLICFCHCVPKKDIVAAIQNGADSLHAVQQETLASTGCGGCESDVLDLLEADKKKS